MDGSGGVAKHLDWIGIRIDKNEKYLRMTIGTNRKSDLKRTKSEIPRVRQSCQIANCQMGPSPYINFFLKFFVLNVFGNLAIWQFREINREIEGGKPSTTPFNPVAKKLASLGKSWQVNDNSIFLRRTTANVRFECDGDEYDGCSQICGRFWCDAEAFGLS